VSPSNPHAIHRVRVPLGSVSRMREPGERETPPAKPPSVTTVLSTDSGGGAEGKGRDAKKGWKHIGTKYATDSWQKDGKGRNSALGIGEGMLVASEGPRERRPGYVCDQGVGARTCRASGARVRHRSAASWMRWAWVVRSPAARSSSATCLGGGWRCVRASGAHPLRGEMLPSCQPPFTGQQSVGIERR